MTTHNGHIRVVYVAGWGRSGSTVLGHILGQAKGSHFGGELQYVWRRGFLENGLCGCGQKFHTCEFWRGIARTLSDRQAPVDFAQMAGWTDMFTRTIQFPRLAARFAGSHKFKQYISGLKKFYEALHGATGGSVIVDSSKSPMYALVVGMIPSVDLCMIHIVRDARAVAYSYSIPKLAKDPSRPVHLLVRGPFFTAVMWTVWNLIVEFSDALRLVHRIRLRYEDFASDPQKQTVRIAKFCSLEAGQIGIERNGQVNLDVNHSASGNPSRFEVGAVRITPDLRWVSSMSSADRRLVGLITWPILLGYGYPLGRW